MFEKTIHTATIPTTETPVETPVETPTETVPAAQPSTWEKAEQVFENEGLIAALEEFGPFEVKAAYAFAYKHGATEVRAYNKWAMLYLEVTLEDGTGDDWTLWSESACLG